MLHPVGGHKAGKPVEDVVIRAMAQRPAVLACNACWETLQHGGFSTPCSHVLCVRYRSLSSCLCSSSASSRSFSGPGCARAPPTTRGRRGARLLLRAQAECATGSTARGQCTACQAPLEDGCAAALCKAETAEDAEQLARRLAVQSSDSLLEAASGALRFLAYQQQLKSARQRSLYKAKIGKMVQASREKLQALKEAQQKARKKQHDARSACIGSLIHHACGRVTSASNPRRRLRSISRPSMAAHSRWQ